MKKPKFTYVIKTKERFSSISIYEGNCEYKTEGLLYFNTDEGLEKFIKENSEYVPVEHWKLTTMYSMEDLVELALQTGVEDEVVTQKGTTERNLIAL